MPPTTPSGSAGEPRPTNQMRLQAQHAWVKLPDTLLSANVPHLDATLVDRTPGDPLTPLAWGSYDLHIRSGAVQLLDSQATTLLQQAGGELLARHQLRDARVRFLPDGRIRVAATAQRAGLPLPVALDFRVARRDSNTVALVPAFSWLTRLGLGAMGLDLMRELSKAVPGSKLEPGGGLALDVRTLSRLHADMQAIAVRDGRLEVSLGPGTTPSRPPGPREGATNWVAIETRGDVSGPQGILRNGRTFSRVEGGPTAPILLNDLPKWVNMRRDAGEAVLDQAALASLIAERVPAFKLQRSRFAGDTLEVAGRYQLSMAALAGLFGLAFGGREGLARGIAAGRSAPDLGVPVSARLRLEAHPDGRLRLTPSGDEVLTNTIRAELAALPGARQDGQGVLLDVSRVAEVDLGPLRRVRAERGQLVLGFDRPAKDG